MYSLISKIWKFKDHQFLSQVVSAENHLAFVLGQSSDRLDHSLKWNSFDFILHCLYSNCLKY